MKKLMFGLLATGFMTLSSFTTAPVTKTTKFDDGCCTAYGTQGSVMVCGFTDNCNRAVAIYLEQF